jgi:hypothetical protein
MLRVQAQSILQHYSDMIPKVEKNQLKRPEQTKNKWIELSAAEPPPPQIWK